MSVNAKTVLSELISLQETYVREAVEKEPESKTKYGQRLDEYKNLVKWIGDSVAEDVVLNESQKSIVSLAITDLMLHPSENGSGTKPMKLMNLIRFMNELR